MHHGKSLLLGSGVALGGASSWEDKANRFNQQTSLSIAGPMQQTMYNANAGVGSSVNYLPSAGTAVSYTAANLAQLAPNESLITSTVR